MKRPDEDVSHAVAHVRHPRQASLSELRSQNGDWTCSEGIDMKQVKRKLSRTMEDYLEAIFVLSQSRRYARTSEIAKDLHV